uniref:Uncharacterized protein n=1 Tax=Candidatus Kentrum sp. MB TaxID=2138164 RepID=A0A450XUZ4_9GAMM|nr:MAG: hypothetical protein BECKMB1821I_GA0114274_10406 [Candidatus Kentron sp. MB]VFK76054.1 MAG: hypothetical protein BECKMB1821H_GA0114242_10406 [Candidatus Kentron sp. MB]
MPIVIKGLCVSTTLMSALRFIYSARLKTPLDYIVDFSSLHLFLILLAVVLPHFSVLVFAVFVNQGVSCLVRGMGRTDMF